MTLVASSALTGARPAQPAAVERRKADPAWMPRGAWIGTGMVAGSLAGLAIARFRRASPTATIPIMTGGALMGAFAGELQSRSTVRDGLLAGALTGAGLAAAIPYSRHLLVDDLVAAALIVGATSGVGAFWGKVMSETRARPISWIVDREIGIVRDETGVPAPRPISFAKAERGPASDAVIGRLLFADADKDRQVTQSELERYFAKADHDGNGTASKDDRPYVPEGRSVARMASGLVTSWDRDRNGTVDLFTNEHVVVRTKKKRTYHIVERVFPNADRAGTPDGVVTGRELSSYIKNKVDTNHDGWVAWTEYEAI